MKKRLKGIDKINKYIEGYINKWDLYAHIDTDFMYDPTEDTVYWTLVVSEKHDRAFQEFFESLGCDIKTDVFVYSIFHEIGHSQTLEKISDEDYNYSHDRKADPNITDEEYFRLPDEIIASKWAVDYINNNIDEVRDFWNGLKPLIMKFYQRNHVI